jgi:hypothetical protein
MIHHRTLSRIYARIEESTDNGKQLVCVKVDDVKKGFSATMANRSLSQFM